MTGRKVNHPFSLGHPDVMSTDGFISVSMVVRASLSSSLADHVSYFLGTHGPSLYIETACSSGQVAMATAIASLRSGQCDYAIVSAAQHRGSHHLELQVRT